MTVLTEMGTFDIPYERRMRFIAGKLWSEWAKEFPRIFDEDDQRLAENQARYHCHFYEWQAAILLYEKTGYLSLIEKYHCKNHMQKQDVLKQLVSQKLMPSRLLELLMNRRQFGYHAQPPDLLAYKTDLADWFFCEVKGPKDKLRPEQDRYFQKLAAVSGKPIQLIQLRLIEDESQKVKTMKAKQTYHT